MPYSKNLTQLSDKIYPLFADASPMPVKDYGWENYLWTSEKFRWAHMQKFYNEKVSIFHCVIMPHTWSNAPIFGFDVNELSGTLVGMFLDLTPVDDGEYFLPMLGDPRPVPEWGDFFSTNFICCKPEADDIFESVDLLKKYLNSVLPGDRTGKDYSEQQQTYITGQKRNPQTHRMLKKTVGEELATEYIETLLFPDVIKCADSR
jgi:hypothetical protein